MGRGGSLHACVRWGVQPDFTSEPSSWFPSAPNTPVPLLGEPLVSLPPPPRSPPGFQLSCPHVHLHSSSPHHTAQDRLDVPIPWMTLSGFRALSQTGPCSEAALSGWPQAAGFWPGCPGEPLGGMAYTWLAPLPLVAGTGLAGLCVPHLLPLCQPKTG